MENKKIETNEVEVKEIDTPVEKVEVKENTNSSTNNNTHIEFKEKIIEREVPVEVVKEVIKEIEVEKEVVKFVRPVLSFVGKPNIIQGLANFNKKLENINKKKDNAFTKSKYLDLATMLEAIRPVLAEEGLYLMQHKVKDPENPINFAVDTYLIHESGEVLEIPGVFTKPDNSNVHGCASLESYERRYRIMCALGIVGSEDDNDGEVAMGRGETTSRQTPKAETTTPAATGRIRNR